MWRMNQLLIMALQVTIFKQPFNRVANNRPKMNMNIIEIKLRELITLAESEGDSATQIICHSLLGAKAIGDDLDLANHVSKYVQDVLLPKVIRGKQMTTIRQN